MVLCELIMVLCELIMVLCEPPTILCELVMVLRELVMQFREPTGTDEENATEHWYWTPPMRASWEATR
eukprot:2694747-Alexandrium_andersonii.AAC.1